MAIDTMFNSASYAVRELAKQQEQLILDQLGALVKEGFLIMESEAPCLVECPDANRIELRQKVRFRLRDQEIIDDLRAQVKTLSEKLASIKWALYDRHVLDESDGDHE